MPITTAWDNDTQTLYRWNFTGHWTWEEFHRSLDEAEASILPLNTTVNLLIDLRQTDGLPSNPLHHIQNALHRKLPQIGTVVIVTQNHFVKLIFNIIRIIDRTDIQLVETLEDAYRLLSLRDARAS